MENLTFDQIPQAVSLLLEKLTTIERLLQEKCNNAKPDTTQLLTIQQSSEFLTLSVPTIYSLVSKREIPFMKKSKRLYFTQSELTEWIKSSRNLKKK